MNLKSASIGMTLLAMMASLAPDVRANLHDQDPLRLGLSPPEPALLAPRRALLEPRMRANSISPQLRRQNGAPPGQLDARAPLRERVLESVLTGSELDAAPDALAATAHNQQRFRLERRSNAGRDLSRSYRDMCNRVSNRLWDEPNGKRIKFDIAGKPGVAFEIPLH